MTFARRLICALALLAVALPASAVITCTASVTNVSVVYDPTSPVDNVTTGSYTVTCNRLGTDPNTFAWQLGVDNGVNAGGGFNRVRRMGGPVGDRYNYDTYRSTGAIWGDTAATRFTGTLNFGAALTASTSGPFDIVFPGSQTVDPAGTYTDTVTVSLRDSANTIINTTTFGVTAITTNSCQISVPPGNVNFAYASFQAAAAAASTSYGVRCTTALPYSMALDASSGTLLGLSYTLTIAPSSTGTGTGATQTYTINGTMPAGQAGTCATAVCSGSQTRTLTLSW
jgi:spore coat protein U-like protein